MERDCKNCLHAEKCFDEEPCSGCFQLGKWESVTKSSDDLGQDSPFTEDANTRKEHPVYSGVIAYFPDAIAEISRVSWVGNEQHNPGTPLHWDRSKSGDELDAMMRHLIDYTKGGRKEELTKVAWRALAMLQKECER